MRLLFALLLVGCTATGNGSDASAPVPDGGPVFNSCTSLCYRPGSCEVAYPDGDICPPGFQCAWPFGCATDGGHD
jgi:hypothetical protein